MSSEIELKLIAVQVFFVLFCFLGFFFFFFLVLLGFELVLTRQVLYHLSHSTSPVLYWVFSR
jgi:hypothetical protein